MQPADPERPAVTGVPGAVPGSWNDLDRPPLRAAALRRALVDGPVSGWRALDVVASTGSTNADVAERARAGQTEGLVLLADHQRSGRGRLDRSWQAPPRAGLAVSVLLRPGVVDAEGRPAVPRDRWSWLSLLAGVAVVDTLTRVCGLPARVKWPNDVLVPVIGRTGDWDQDQDDQRKVCGILAEVVHDAGDAVVLGVGINVSQEAAELPVPQATSLALAGAATTDRDTIARAYLRALAGRYRAWREVEGDPVRSGLGAAYRESCGTLGLRVRVHLPDGQWLEGTAEQVDAAGRLVVLDAAGRERALAAGDVVHVRPAGSAPDRVRRTAPPG